MPEKKKTFYEGLKAWQENRAAAAAAQAAKEKEEADRKKKEEEEKIKKMLEQKRFYMDQARQSQLNRAMAEE